MANTTKRKSVSPDKRSGPVTVSWFHPVAYDTAMMLAGEDRQRVHIASDGSGAVIVSNERKRPDWMGRP